MQHPWRLAALGQSQVVLEANQQKYLQIADLSLDFRNKYLIRIIYIYSYIIVGFLGFYVLCLILTYFDTDTCKNSRHHVFQIWR